MASYSNGRYPLNNFIYRGGNIYLSPSLNARWNEAVRLALEKYGVRLYITGNGDGLGGWNGYRPYSAQIIYRNYYGEMAATPGYSSHGGYYSGQEVFALDVNNWADLAPGNRSLAWARFKAIMTIVGLRTDFVSPQELWHVGDFNNAWAVPAFGQVTIKPGTTNKPKPASEEEDEDMKGMYFTRGGKTVYALFNDDSGFYVEFTGTNPSGNNEIAKNWKTETWMGMTESVAAAIQRSCAEVRQAK